MKQLLILLTILVCTNCYSQNNLNEELTNHNNLEYDIVGFDTLCFLSVSGWDAVCVEKKVMPLYASQSDDFYSSWQFLPDSYILWIPVMQDRFLEEFVKPRVKDPLLIKELEHNFYPNGFPKVDGRQLVFDNKQLTFRNLKYWIVNCYNFIVISLPYKTYKLFVDSYIHYDPVQRKDSDALTDSTYVRILYPLPNSIYDELQK